MKTHLTLAGMLALMPFAAALAAPFCVDVTGIPLQCLYVDPALCQHEAARQNGQCSPNPAEFRTPVSAQQYCLVEAGNLVSCLYPDRSDCNVEATRRHGACIQAIPQTPAVPAPAPGVDLFAVKRPY